MKTVCFCHNLQLHLAFVDSIFPAYHFTFKMKTNAEITSQMERLRLRAIRKNQRAGRVLKRMERELQKRKPNLAKVIEQQKKSARYTSQSLKYLDKRQHLLIVNITHGVWKAGELQRHT